MIYLFLELIYLILGVRICDLSKLGIILFYALFNLVNDLINILFS